MGRCYGLTITTSPQTRAQRRPIRSRILSHRRVRAATLRVFEHCEARSVPCGGGTVTRSMRRDANATLIRFDRYDEPPDSRTETPDPITGI